MTAIPDVRTRQPTALWDAESTYTEASPRPGRPVPSRDTEALLLASGAQADGTVLDLLAVEGGPVGRDPRAAGLAWKNSGDGANAYRGREIPATLSGWEVVSWQTGAGMSNPDMVTLSTEAYRDQVVMVAQEAPDGDVVAWTRATDGTWSSKITVYDGAALGAGLFPCLVECGPRLFCLHYAVGPGSGADEYFIRVHMSLDGGATWETVRSRASVGRNLKTGITFSASPGGDYEIRSLRAAYKDGQVLVVSHLWEQLATGASAAADCIIQWASSNLATKLEQVEISGTGVGFPPGGKMDITVAGGSFVVAMASSESGVQVARVSSAYAKISQVWEGVSSALLVYVTKNGASPLRQDDADIAIVTDDVGLVWLYCRIAGSGGLDDQQTQVIYSDDDGATWARVGVSDDGGAGSDSAPIWSLGRGGGGGHYASAYPRGFAACWQRGRALLVHGWEATTGTNDNSLAVAYLGGYSDLTIAPIRDAAELVDRHPWARTLLPIERAQDTTPWTASSSGAVANSLQSDGSEILSSGDGVSTGALAVSATDGTTGDALMVATFAAKGSNSGASATADRTAFTFRVDDGTRGVEVGIYLEPQAFGVYDRVTPVQKALVTGLDNVVREWRIGVYATEDATVKRCRVWYRTWDQSEDRTWTFVGAYSLADDGGTVGSNRVAFGCFTTGITQADLEVYHGPHFSVGVPTDSRSLSGTVYTWDVWAAATDNPDHLSLTPMSSLPVYVSGGVSVRGVDGPAMASDSWTLAPAYEYPIERIWPSYARSPRVRWRSVDDTAQVTIALSLDPELLGTVDSAVGAPLLGLHLAGINWRFGSIQRYTGAAWVTVTTIDAATAFGNLSCTRTGATVVPSADTTHQIAGQELIGWDYRELAPPGVVRRIKANRGGRWATGTTAGPRASLMLDKIDNTEATSTDAVLSARNLCVVFEHAAATAAAGWRLVIDIQDTVEGWFEIGSMMFGPVWVSGQPTDWGRRTEQVLGTAYRRQQDGAIQAAQPTPAGMAVDVAWTGGVDSRQFHDGTAEPTYITTTATSGITGPATWAATVYDLQHELAGLGSHPVVYLPKIERAAAGDVRQLTRWYEYLLAYVPSGLTVTHAVGDEGTDETMTVGTLTLEPEL
jgi:hypothetical protein